MGVMNLDKIFRDYDIRGKVPGELTAQVAYKVGQALAQVLPEGTVAVGRDMRPDSGTFVDNLMKGLLQAGREVWDLNLVTVDMLYFAVGKFKLAGGAMVTASHNSKGYNGIKICSEGAVPVAAGSGLEQIKNLVQSNVESLPTLPTGRQGRQAGQKSKVAGKLERKDIMQDWISHVLSFVESKHWKPLKLAIDAGNGMAGHVMPQFIKQTPLQATPLWWELDGDFPNRPSDPTIPANLKTLCQMVKDNGLDLGLAFDGDGDRVALVDESGQVVSPNIITAVLADAILAKQSGTNIVVDVRASRLIEDATTEAGGRVIRAAAGMPHIEAAMRQHSSPFGAEASAHYYFKDNYFAYSGLIAAALVIEVLSKSGKKLSQVVAQYQKYFQSGELNFTVSNQQAAIAKVAEAFKDGQADQIDDLTVHYPNWWFNLRASNTEPLLRLNVEADTKELLDEKVKQIQNLIT